MARARHRAGADADQHRQLPGHRGRGAASSRSTPRTCATCTRRAGTRPAPPPRPACPIYAGTDAGGGIAHGRIADEVAALHGVGMSPTDALGAACWDARAWLGRQAVELGAPADLLVYRDDPRAEPAVLAPPRAGHAARPGARTALDGPRAPRGRRSGRPRSQVAVVRWASGSGWIRQPWCTATAQRRRRSTARRSPGVGRADARPEPPVVRRRWPGRRRGQTWLSTDLCAICCRRCLRPVDADRAGRPGAVSVGPGAAEVASSTSRARS